MYTQAAAVHQTASLNSAQISVGGGCGGGFARDMLTHARCRWTTSPAKPTAGGIRRGAPDADAECVRRSSSDVVLVMLQVKWGIDLASEHERYLTEEVFRCPAPQTAPTGVWRLNACVCC
jgi:hypothetical protein